MFREFSRPSSGAQWLQWQPLVLPSYRGNSRAAFVVGPTRPRTQHDCHHDTKVKPDAAAGTAVIERLMMGWKTPVTCWAVNKRQDNKLEHCYIWLVIYLNFGMKSHDCRAKHRYVRQPLPCMFVRKCSGRLLLARLLREPIISRHSTNVRLMKQSMNCHPIRRSDLVHTETRRTTGHLLLPNFETVCDNFGRSNFELLNSKYNSLYAVLIGPFITSDGADDLQV